MSRVGKKPIDVPGGVKIEIKSEEILVKGPKGALTRTIPSLISVELVDGQIQVKRLQEIKRARELHGLIRTLIANMVTGVEKGFEKGLEMRGIGYRGECKGKELSLSIGFSHPVVFPIPEGIDIEVIKRPSVAQMAVINIMVRGIDKELVGQTCAKVRAADPPEPYKGKGIRNMGEYVRKKAGKRAV